MADGDRLPADFSPFDRLTLDAYAQGVSTQRTCVKDLSQRRMAGIGTVQGQ